jgi:hypothetical protein
MAVKANCHAQSSAAACTGRALHFKPSWKLQPNWPLLNCGPGAYSAANILVRMFRECRGVLGIRLHYRSIDPLKFIICFARAPVAHRRKEVRALTSSIGVSSA